MTKWGENKYGHKWTHRAQERPKRVEGEGWGVREGACRNRGNRGTKTKKGKGEITGITLKKRTNERKTREERSSSQACWQRCWLGGDREEDVAREMGILVNDGELGGGMYWEKKKKR